MTAIDCLIEAVEAGGISTDLIQDVFGDGWTDIHALAAFDGSLDAAKALHEALLPEWEWWVNSKWYWDESEGPLVTVRTGKPVIDLQVFHGKASDPARAWLLAILRAVKNNEATK